MDQSTQRAKPSFSKSSVMFPFCGEGEGEGEETRAQLRGHGISSRPYVPSAPLSPSCVPGGSSPALLCPGDITGPQRALQGLATALSPQGYQRPLSLCSDTHRALLSSRAVQVDDGPPVPPVGTP